MLTAKEVTRLLDIANAGVNKGQIALARKVYEGILAGRPDHAPTLISLALSHVAVSEYDRAEEILRRILDVNPEDADALAYLGLAAKLAGRDSEARRDSREDPRRHDCTHDAADRARCFCRRLIMADSLLNRRDVDSTTADDGCSA